MLNRNIVIKKEGNKLLLPTVERKEIEIANKIPPNTFAMCRITAYDQNSGTLSLKLSYEAVGDSLFRIAIEENSELLSKLYITKIIFVDHSSLSSSSTAAIKTNDFYKKDLSYKERISKQEIALITTNEEYRWIVPKEKEIINIPILLSVNELKFLDGKTTFEYYIKHVSRNVTFEILNPFLKKEFDSVKNYFPKVLNISKFTATIELEYLDGRILSQTCTSPHISQINESLFELIEDLYISDHITNGVRDEIISLNEIALDSSEMICSEKIKDPEWLLNKLISPGKTKHYYHLRYLSDHHSSNTFNLRLTGKPLSFIFLLSTPTGFSLIWETYSTQEATYVWKLGNLNNSELSIPLQELIDCIKWLRANNKIAYVKTKPENFLRIEHDYSGEDLGFKKWKSQLEGFIFGDDKSVPHLI